MGSFFLWGSGYDLIWSPKVIPIQDGFQAKDCALGENHVVVYGKNREGVSEVYSWGHGGLGQVHFLFYIFQSMKFLNYFLI